MSGEKFGNLRIELDFFRNPDIDLREIVTVEILLKHFPPI